MSKTHIFKVVVFIIAILQITKIAIAASFPTGLYFDSYVPQFLMNFLGSTLFQFATLALIIVMSWRLTGRLFWYNSKWWFAILSVTTILIVFVFVGMLIAGSDVTIANEIRHIHQDEIASHLFRVFSFVVVTAVLSSISSFVFHKAQNYPSTW